MPEWGAIPVRRCPMNVTVRASLIALIAIVGVCWAIPVLLVSVVPSDAGMIAMMALIYPVPRNCNHPRSARRELREDALLGTRSARNRTRAPVSHRGRGQPGPCVPWGCLYRNRLRRHGPAHLDDCSTTSLSHRPASLHKPDLPAAMARIAATIMQVNPMQNNFCSARQALPHMMYNRFDSAPDVFAGRSFTTGR